MLSNASLKVLNFSCTSDQFRYKFPCHESVEIIDQAIRMRFKIPSDEIYSLLDQSDNTNISLSTLQYLPNESNVEVQLIKTVRLARASSNLIPENLHHHVSSFSDDKSPLKNSDLSSTSTSDSDYEARLTINYHSVVPASGFIKANDAKAKRKRIEMNVIWNRKVNHFMEKYGNIRDVDCRNVIHDIMSKLNISKAELYNLVKFMRHNMDLSSLHLNKENIVDILLKIYQKDYRNK